MTALVCEGRSASDWLEQMLAQLKSGGYIPTRQVEQALTAVPRHVFVPGTPLENVYGNIDQPICTKYGTTGECISSLSAPTVYALMLEQLGLEAGQRVLEIGAGTGYHAALMAHLVGKTGKVVTVDIDEDIAEGAREHLAVAGFRHVTVICADGAFGYADAAPYDRIVLTVSAEDIAPAWQEQLKPSGRLLLPFVIRSDIQKTFAFEKVKDHLASISMTDCMFMPFRGLMSVRKRSRSLGPEPGLNIGVDDSVHVDGETLHRLLVGPHHDMSTQLQVTGDELWDGLRPWLALREPNYCVLLASGDGLKRNIVPNLFGVADQYCSTGGLFDGTARIALLMRSPGASPPSVNGEDASPFTLYVRSYGLDDELANHLIDQVGTWDAAGRPTLQQLRIKAYPLDRSAQTADTESVLLTPSTQLVLTWEPRS